MIANLSIVLDKDKRVRLDLIQNVELSKIDEYTTKFSSSSEIRKVFQEEIAQFLIEQKDMIRDFKGCSNRRGNLVIVYSNEFGQLHRMRVLYQENEKKLNVDILIKGIFDELRKQQDPFFTIDLMRNFSFFLGAPFDLREIEKIERNMNSSVKLQKNQNQRLINIIRNHILYAIQQDFEKGYFYLRLMDAYLERKGFVTTKRSVPTKAGTLEVLEVPYEPVVLQKEQSHKQISSDTDTSYFLESDGQYAFFDLGRGDTSSSCLEEEKYYKYEHFLENSADVKGQLELKL